MGCDIHLYAEWKRQGDSKWFTLASDWEGWRDYQTFGRLAGVRGCSPLIDPRGMPSDPSYDVHEAFYEQIDWRGEHRDKNGYPQRGWVSREEAEQRIAGGEKPMGEIVPTTWHSITHVDYPLSDEPSPEPLYETRTDNADLDGKPIWLRAADWHTPTWLTGEEFRAALHPSDHAVYHALASACQVMEQAGHQTRLVFWFDN